MTKSNTQLPIDLPSAAAAADWVNGRAEVPAQKFVANYRSGFYYGDGSSDNPTGIASSVNGQRKMTITDFGLDIDGLVNLRPSAPLTPNSGINLYYDGQVKFRNSSGIDASLLVADSQLDYSSEFRVSINGNNALHATPTELIIGNVDSYSFPMTRGTKDQIIVTDETGSASWTEQRDTFILSDLIVDAGVTKNINVSALGAGLDIIGATATVSIDDTGSMTTGPITGVGSPDISGFGTIAIDRLDTEDLNFTGLSLMNIAAAGSLTVSHNSVERLFIDNTTLRIGTAETGWNLNLNRGENKQVLSSDGAGGSNWVSLVDMNSLYGNDGAIPHSTTRTVSFNTASTLDFANYLTISSNGDFVHVGTPAAGWDLPLDRPTTGEYIRSVNNLGDVNWRDFDSDVRNLFSVTGGQLTYNSATGTFDMNIGDDFSIFANNGTLTGNRTVNMAGNNFIFTQPGVYGNSIVRIDADSDNSNENACPQLLLNSDGGATFLAMGISGSANQFFPNTSINGGYLIADHNLVLGSYDRGRINITSLSTEFSHRIITGYSTDTDYSITMPAKNGSFGYLGYLTDDYYIRSNSGGNIRINTNGTDLAVFDDVTTINTPTTINGTLNLGSPGNSTFSQTLTSKSGNLGYLGFYDDFFIIRSDVSGGAINIQNEGSNSVHITADSILLSRPTTFNNTATFDNMATFNNTTNFSQQATFNGNLLSESYLGVDGIFNVANTCVTTFNSNVTFKNDLVVRNDSNDVIFQADNNGIVANREITIGWQGVGAPQLIFKDDDGSNNGLIRILANNTVNSLEHYDREALFIHALSGQAGMVFATENGGDYIWLHDTSTDSNFSHPSMRLYHPNVGTNTIINSPQLQLGNSLCTNTEFNMTCDNRTSRWSLDNSGNVILGRDNVDMLTLGLQSATFDVTNLNITSYGNADLNIIADSLNLNENAVPSFTMRQDGGLLAIRMGGIGTAGSKFSDTEANSSYIESGNSMQIRSKNALAQTIDGVTTRLENAIIMQGEIRDSVRWAGQDFGSVTSAALASDTTPPTSSFGSVNLGSFQVRWGMITSNNDKSQTFYFGKPFSTNCMVVVLTNRTEGVRNAMSLTGWNSTRFYINRDDAQNDTVIVSYIAFGY